MHTLFLRIRTDRISLFRFLLEGYDGLAMLSTVDVQQGLGLVRLIVPKDRHAELWQLLAAVCGELAVPQATVNEEGLRHGRHRPPPLRKDSDPRIG